MGRRGVFNSWDNTSKLANFAFPACRDFLITFKPLTCRRNLYAVDEIPSTFSYVIWRSFPQSEHWWGVETFIWLYPVALFSRVEYTEMNLWTGLKVEGSKETALHGGFPLELESSNIHPFVSTSYSRFPPFLELTGPLYLKHSKRAIFLIPAFFYQ